MLSGLFQSAAGMKVRLQVQEIIANNLANAQTAGFQREIASIQSHAQARPGPGEGASPAATYVRTPSEFLEIHSSPDRRPGALHDTAAPADLALDGEGYLLVQSPSGPRLIRGGHMSVNARGQLATSAGDPLQSTDGSPITVGDRRWRVAADGTVSVNDAPVGRLRIVLPEGLTRREGAQLLWAASLKDAPAGSVRVLQGFIEHSNVNAVGEMVEMIAGMRAYETAQRAFLAQDQTLQSLFDAIRR